MRGRLQGGHADPRRPDHRGLAWLTPVLVWLSVLIGGTLAAGHYWLPSLLQDLAAAARSSADAIKPGDPDWQVARDIATQTWPPMMRMFLPFALVVLTANLAASGTSRLLEAAIRRGRVSRGPR